jgi:hypothetical protein
VEYESILASMTPEQRAKSKLKSDLIAKREGEYIASTISHRAFYHRLFLTGYYSDMKDVYYSDYETALRFLSIFVNYG